MSTPKTIDTVIAERIADRIERDGGVYHVDAAAEEARIALTLAVMARERGRVRVFKIRGDDVDAMSA